MIIGLILESLILVLYVIILAPAKPCKQKAAIRTNLPKSAGIKVASVSVDVAFC